MGEKVEYWRDSVENLAEVARRHPQTTYVGLQKSLQKEGAFVQYVTLDTGMAFQVVEDELRDNFLPSLFQGSTYQIPGRAITFIPIKQADIALPNLTRTAGANWTMSYTITGNLVPELYGTDEFRSGNHVLLMGEER